MSTDYSVICISCEESSHLGQRMAMTYSFGYGSKDITTPPKIMEWIAGHVDNGHNVKVVNSEDTPTSFEYEGWDQ